MITHNLARFYMALKYLNKERTFKMWDYIDKNEQLAKDVARYFELKPITRKEPHEREEFDDLEDKLSKVGKEE